MQPFLSCKSGILLYFCEIWRRVSVYVGLICVWKIIFSTVLPQETSEVGFSKNILLPSESEIARCSVFFMWLSMPSVHLVGKLNVLHVHVY